MSDSVDSPELIEKFQRILRDNKGFKNKIVSRVGVSSPNLQGEQFGSTCKYITLSLNGGAETLELFSKEIPANGFHSVFIKEWKLFEKESNFFNQLLPDMQQYYMEKSGSKKPMDFFPTCFYADDKEIIMENLVKAKGYYLSPKAERQDLEHATLVMENYAQFHAVGYAMIQEFGKGTILDKYHESLDEITFTRKNPMMMQMFENTRVAVAGLLNNYKVPGCEKAMQVLEKYSDNYAERLFELVEHDDSKQLFFVINHGDAWNNNMLFLKDSATKKVKHHVLVDFQITRCCSPNMDLVYYLFSSLNTDARKYHLKEIFEAYFKKLSSTVQQLTKAPLPFTFEEFMGDFKAKSILGYWMFVAFVVMIDVMASLDVSKIEGDLAAFFNQAMTKWIKENPEKAREKTIQVVEFSEEFEKFVAQF